MKKSRDKRERKRKMERRTNSETRPNPRVNGGVASEEAFFVGFPELRKECIRRKSVSEGWKEREKKRGEVEVERTNVPWLMFDCSDEDPG